MILVVGYCILLSSKIVKSINIDKTAKQTNGSFTHRGYGSYYTYRINFDSITTFNNYNTLNVKTILSVTPIACYQAADSTFMFPIGIQTTSTKSQIWGECGSLNVDYVAVCTLIYIPS